MKQVINHGYENQPGELTEVDWWSWKVEIIRPTWTEFLQYNKDITVPVCEMRLQLMEVSLHREARHPGSYQTKTQYFCILSLEITVYFNTFSYKVLVFIHIV